MNTETPCSVSPRLVAIAALMTDWPSAPFWRSHEAPERRAQQIGFLTESLSKEALGGGAPGRRYGIEHRHRQSADGESHEQSGP